MKSDPVTELFRFVVMLAAVATVPGVMIYAPELTSRLAGRLGVEAAAGQAASDPKLGPAAALPADFRQAGLAAAPAFGAAAVHDSLPAPVVAGADPLEPSSAFAYSAAAGDASSQQPPVVTASFESPLPAAATTVASASADPAGVDAQIERLAAWLQQTGALWYRLETCGIDGSCYRFICAMPGGAESPVERHYESVAAAPLEALLDVARQIEQDRIEASARVAG